MTLESKSGLVGKYSKIPFTSQIGFVLYHSSRAAPCRCVIGNRKALSICVKFTATYLVVWWSREGRTMVSLVWCYGITKIPSVYSHPWSRLSPNCLYSQAYLKKSLWLPAGVHTLSSKGLLRWQSYGTAEQVSPDGKSK